MPASGRKSQRICRSVSSLWTAGNSGTCTVTVPPRRPGAARAPDLEPGRVGEVDQQLRLPERVLADAVDADLLDQVVARRRRVVRGHVRRAGEEPRRAGRVVHLLLEAERALVRLPARVGRREPLGEVGPDVEPAVPRAAAEPLDRAADGEVDAERRDVEGHDPGGLVAVEDHVRADLVRAADDRLDVLDLARLEEDVADRDEQRPLVDRVDDRRRRPRRRRPRAPAAPGRGSARRGSSPARRRPGCGAGRSGRRTRARPPRRRRRSGA